ncbi:hypothetical protein WJX75_007907 [Coccomyxa subellipsoidea]|uniref:Uncharacterized protein n=1 Tax=Coccomyxa subellipsoidea TaxID=248742 RepID=A0ABR2YUJ0_9CHLO
MIVVSIERGSGEGPFELRPPKTAQRVIEVVAKEMGAETGSLKVGRLLLDGEDDIAAGSYMFKPVYNARKTRFLEECLASLHLPAADLPDELKPHAHLLSSCFTARLGFKGKNGYLRFHLHFVAIALANNLRNTDGVDSKAPVVMLLALDDYQTVRQTAGKQFTAACTEALGRWMSTGPRYGIIAMCVLAGSGVETTVPDHTHELAVALPVLSFSEITNMMRNYWLTCGSSKDASRLSPDVVNRLMQEGYVRNTMNGTCGNPGFVVMAAQALNPVDVHKSLSSKYEDGYRRAAINVHSEFERQITSLTPRLSGVESRDSPLEVLLFSFTGNPFPEWGESLYLEKASSACDLIWIEKLPDDSLRAFLPPSIQDAYAYHDEGETPEILCPYFDIRLILDDAYEFGREKQFLLLVKCEEGDSEEVSQLAAVKMRLEAVRGALERYLSSLQDVS